VSDEAIKPSVGVVTGLSYGTERNNPPNTTHLAVALFKLGDQLAHDGELGGAYRGKV
jgi:hypothetical protein